MEACSMEDLENLIAGGVPATPLLKNDLGRLNVIAIAAKTAAAHKGIILPHEMEHLHALGIDLGNELAEILFISAQIAGLNMVMPHYVNQGVPIADFLKKIGPFKKTVYKSLSEAEPMK
jgi:hypothetical protein